MCQVKSVCQVHIQLFVKRKMPAAIAQSYYLMQGVILVAYFIFGQSK